MKIAISTHPETISQLLARSLHLYRLSFSHVFFLSLTLSFIAFIPRLFSIVIGQDIFGDLSLLNLNRLWLLVIFFGCLTLFAAILWRIRCIVIDEHESIFEDLEVAVKKLPYIFVSTILPFLMVTIFLLTSIFITVYLVIDPNLSTAVIDFKRQILINLLLILQFSIIIYLFFAFIFYLPIIVIENNGILPSLNKSAALVWGNWWRTFSLQLTPWLIYWAVIVAIKLIMGINVSIYQLGPVQSTSWLATILQILIFAIFIPWFGTVMLVQLRDLELRQLSH